MPQFQPLGLTRAVFTNELVANSYFGCEWHGNMANQLIFGFNSPGRQLVSSVR
jgi:hypothetical protein